MAVTRAFARFLRPPQERRQTRTSLRMVEVVTDNGDTVDIYLSGHTDVLIEAVPKMSHHGTFDVGDTLVCAYEDGYIVVLGKEAG